MFHTLRLVTGSIPVVGSSRKTTFGSPIKAIAKDNEIQYTRENISSYFLGSISVSRDYNNEAFEHLKGIY